MKHRINWSLIFGILMSIVSLFFLVVAIVGLVS